MGSIERDPDTGELGPWRDLLASCRATQQVVALANEFIGKMSPDELLHLPEECKPRFIRNASDLSGYAVDLKMCRCRDLREAQVVEKLGAFFQDASQRLSVLTGPHRLVGPSLWGDSSGDRPSGGAARSRPRGAARRRGAPCP